MIHISSNLYLSQRAAEAGLPLIGYQSILDISNVSADSSPEATPVVNLVNEQTNQFWISDSLSEQYIYFNNSEFDDIDYIGIAKSNFGTGGIEYQLQYSEDGDSWEDVFDGLIPENDNAIVHHFDTLSVSFFRLRIDPDSVEPRIAHIKLGKVLAMPRCIRAPHSAITLSRETDKVNNTSENGAFLGRIIKRRYLQSSYEFKNINPLYYRQYIHPFSTHAQTGAFFIAWKPLTYPTEVAYGWTMDDISFHADNDNGAGTVSFGVKAVA
jgi:hypothetical protein